MYVGEYEHGFFATNSLVDETTVTVAVSTYYLFIPEICVQKNPTIFDKNIAKHLSIGNALYALDTLKSDN